MKTPISPETDAASRMCDHPMMDEIYFFWKYRNNAGKILRNNIPMCFETVWHHSHHSAMKFVFFGLLISMFHSGMITHDHVFDVDKLGWDMIGWCKWHVFLENWTRWCFLKQKRRLFRTWRHPFHLRQMQLRACATILWWMKYTFLEIQKQRR